MAYLTIDKANNLSRSKDFEEEFSELDTMKGKYLTFWTEEQIFGMSISFVVQIVKTTQITPVPDFPCYAKGVINLRGNIIPVIDMRLRLGKTEAVYDDRTCIIVTNIQGADVGFIVDDVDEVTEIAFDDIVQPPRFASDSRNSFLSGIGKHEDRIILLLDMTQIMDNEELKFMIQKGEN